MTPFAYFQLQILDFPLRYCGIVEDPPQTYQLFCSVLHLKLRLTHNVAFLKLQLCNVHPS